MQPVMTHEAFAQVVNERLHLRYPDCPKDFRLRLDPIGTDSSTAIGFDFDGPREWIGRCGEIEREVAKEFNYEPLLYT